MRYVLLVMLCISFLFGCTGNSTDKPSGRKLTKQQRDSVLSESKLPGARSVKKAIAVSDSAAARAKRLDDLTK
jgi:hypothetical protein